MEMKTKELELRQIAAILFAVLAGLTFLSTLFGIPYMRFTNVLFVFINIAGYAMIAYALFIGRRDQILAAGFGVVAVLTLLNFLSGFSSGLFYMSHWYNGMQFSLFAMLPPLVDLLGYLAACFVVVAILTDYIPKFRELAAKIWFVPSILFLAAFVIAFFVYILCAIGLIGGWWLYGSSYLGFMPFIRRVIQTAAFFLALSWIVSPDSLPANFGLSQKISDAEGVVKPIVEDAAYCGLFKHTLLSILTFGIWPLIWIYRRTGFLNCVEDEPKQTPLFQLLLCLFVPFYTVYWTHRNAQRLEKYVQSKGMECEISTLCLITSLTGTLIPSIIMQEKINACVAPTGEIAVDETQAGLTAKAEVGLVKHTLLLIHTFGVWHFIWIYFATKELNIVNGEPERNPVTKLLLCMFVPFYIVYWYYVTAQRIDKFAQSKGVKSELATWVLILSIFVPVVPSILMQDKINKLV